MRPQIAHDAGADPLAALLSGSLPRAGGDQGDRITEVRRRGREAFLSMGLPTRRDENWRYTDLSLVRGKVFRTVTPADVARPVDRVPKLLGARRNASRLVFVNGGFRADLSSPNTLPAAISVTPLANSIDASSREMLGQTLCMPAPLFANPLVALNAAMVDDGVLITVDKAVDADVWIELVFLGGAAASVAFAPRHIVRIGDTARLGIVEHHIGLPGEAVFANTVMQIELERGANLRHYRVIDGGPDAANAITTFVGSAEDARYEAFALILGGGFNRIETTVQLDGARALCLIGGAYTVGGDDFCDNTTLVAHRAPKTTSRQVFKGVVDDHGHAVFQGRVIVERAAQEADGHQLSKAILLSETAEIDQKPALEIFADNVKCSHGAAVGQLDQTAMFYLRSRGLSEAMARQMLLEGFLAEVLLEVSDEEVRRELSERIAAAVRGTGKEKG